MEGWFQTSDCGRLIVVCPTYGRQKKKIKFPYPIPLLEAKLKSWSYIYIYIYNISDMRDIFEIVYCCRIVLHSTYILFVCFFDDLNWKQGVFWELHLHLHLLKCFLGNMSESNASVLLLRVRTEIYVKHWRYVIQTFTSFIITEKTLQLHTQVDNL